MPSNPFDHPIAFSIDDPTADKVQFLDANCDRNFYIHVENQVIFDTTQALLDEAQSGLTLKTISLMALSILYTRWTADEPYTYRFSLCATFIYTDRKGNELKLAILSGGASGTNYERTEKKAIASLARILIEDYPGRLERGLARQAMIDGEEELTPASVMKLVTWFNDQAAKAAKSPEGAPRLLSTPATYSTMEVAYLDVRADGHALRVKYDFYTPGNGPVEAAHYYGDRFDRFSLNEGEGSLRIGWNLNARLVDEYRFIIEE